jgi:hypothetical protein
MTLGAIDPYQQAHFVHSLVLALTGRIRKRVIVAGDRIIGAICREKFGGFQFFSADARLSLGRNVPKNDQRSPGQVRKVDFLGQMEK